MIDTPRISSAAKLTILSIVGIAAVLRLWTIGQGLPYDMFDELEIIGRAVTMMKAGDFNPHFWDYPGLYIYVQLIVACARFLVGALGRHWSSLGAAPLTAFFLWARVSTALFGVLTVYVVYRAARQWGELAALLAALIMAIHPFHVRESHFALTDTPMTLLVAVTLLVSIHAARDGRLRWFALAGVVAGAAAATKYNGAVALVMPLVAALFSRAVRTRPLATLVVLSSVAAGFVIGAPYSVLDLPGFLNGFAGLVSHYNTRRPDSAGTYFKYLQQSLGFGSAAGAIFAWPALFFAVWGIGAITLRTRFAVERAACVMLLAFPIAYFWMITNQSNLQYGRYLLPMLPAIAVVIGVGLASGVRLISLSVATTSRRAIAHVVVIALVMTPPFSQAFGNDRSQAHTVKTQALAYQWLMANVGPGERVVSESLQVRLYDPIKWDYTTSLILDTADGYRAQGVTYLVSSTLESNKFLADPAAHPAKAAAYVALFHATEIVKIFSPDAHTDGPTLTILRVR